MLLTIERDYEMSVSFDKNIGILLQNLWFERIMHFYPIFLFDANLLLRMKKSGYLNRADISVLANKSGQTYVFSVNRGAIWCDLINRLTALSLERNWKKMNATRSGIYARLKRARRRVRSFFQTKSRKKSASSSAKREIKRDACLECRTLQVWRDVTCVCAHASMHHSCRKKERAHACSLSFSLVHSASYLRILGGETRA